MIVVNYRTSEEDAEGRAGILYGGHVLDVAAALDLAAYRFSLMLPREVMGKQKVGLTELLGANRDVLKAVQETLYRLILEDTHAVSSTMDFFIPIHRVTFLSPILVAPSILNFYAFEGHYRNICVSRGVMGLPPTWYKSPTYEQLQPCAIYGPDVEIPYPSPSQALDYEFGVACVIGVGGTNVRTEDAESHIAGFTIMNRWTPRDEKKEEAGTGHEADKKVDGFKVSLGPYLVGVDDLENHRVSRGIYDLTVSARVNGKQYSKGNLKDMHWGFADLVAKASQIVMLQPGDIIGSGAVTDGSILDLGSDRYDWLKPGDHVELEVEYLGRLVNSLGPSIEPRQETRRLIC